MRIKHALIWIENNYIYFKTVNSDSSLWSFHVESVTFFVILVSIVSPGGGKLLETNRCVRVVLEWFKNEGPAQKAHTMSENTTSMQSNFLHQTKINVFIVHHI